MNRGQKLELLSDWLDATDRLKKAFDGFLDSDLGYSELCNASWHVHRQYTDAVAKILEAHCWSFGSWLSWWLYDVNRDGKISIFGKEYHVTNIEELLEVIEAWREVNI